MHTTVYVIGIAIIRIRLKGKPYSNPKNYFYPAGLDSKLQILCTTDERQRWTNDNKKNMIGIEAAFDSVEEIIDFSIPNQVQYFY